MMKKLMVTVLLAAMLLAMIPAASLTVSAADVEGMWTTYRHAGDYYDPEDLEPGEEPPVYKPEAGYTYTDEGFTVVPASYKDTEPFMTVQTKEKQSAKDGIYLQFRVDDFSYDGGTGADEWIALSLSTGNKTCPGQVWNGGGWLTLMRGKGDGKFNSLPHLTDPRTEDFAGSFTNVGSIAGTAPVDDQGREIYTFEVSWTGSAYEIFVNGAKQPGGSQTTALLERLDKNGDFYVGVTLKSNVGNGTAAITVLKYGTSEDTATTPVGTDSKEPEPNEIHIAEIADPSTVEANTPAMLWSTDTYGLIGNNCTVTVLGDDTWRFTPTDFSFYFYWSPKRSQSFAATDFPVFGILVRNITTDGGNLWYAAGEVTGPHESYIQAFSFFDGEFYYDAAENAEYCFVPVDLTGLWEGRINNLRMDLAVPNVEGSEFDVCFAGVFRSAEEGQAYAEAWLADRGIDAEEATTEEATTEEPATEAPTDEVTEAPTDAPEQGGDATEAPTEAPTDEPKSGCGSVIGFSAVAILAAAAAAVALKKD